MKYTWFTTVFIPYASMRSESAPSNVMNVGSIPVLEDPLEKEMYPIPVLLPVEPRGA